MRYNNTEMAARFIFVAERFIYFLKTRKCSVNFDQSVVEDSACGTVACHGGFALLALYDQPAIGHASDYRQGANALGRHLGFENHQGLLDWARDNPDLWGSPYGDDMFDGEDGHLAFNGEEGKISLEDIASWYLKVAERLLNEYN